MGRTFGIEVLECTRFHATMRAVAVIPNPEIVEKILSHLRLPLAPSPTVDERIVRYELEPEHVPDWVVGVDPERYEGGPPSESDRVDPPSPDE